MGKETGFNRKQKQYIEAQRKKLADRKRNQKDKAPVTVLKGEVTQKKLRREERKLQIKLAKKAVKRQKRDGMNLEEEGGDNDNVDEEM